MAGLVTGICSTCLLHISPYRKCVLFVLESIRDNAENWVKMFNVFFVQLYQKKKNDTECTMNTEEKKRKENIFYRLYFADIQLDKITETYISINIRN